MSLIEIETERGLLLRDDRSQVIVRVGQPGLFVVVGEGHISRAIGERALQLFNDHTPKDTTFLSFIDASRVTSIVVDLVDSSKFWVSGRRTHSVSHMLVRSKLVHMTISAINLVSTRPVIEAYSDESAFLDIARRHWTGFVLPTLPRRNK